MSTDYKELQASALASAKSAATTPGETMGVLARMGAARALVKAALQLLSEGGVECLLTITTLGACMEDYRCPCNLCREKAREKARAKASGARGMS